MADDPRKTEDETLFSRARAGDIDAFAELFEPLRGLIHAVACRLAGPDDADDVVMETFLKAWEALPRLRKQTALSSWLCRIARNCAYDLLRSRSRRSRHTSELDAVDEDGRPLEETIADPATPTPEEDAERRELGRLLDEAVASLDEPHRITFLLREVDGLQYAEIAAATGVRIGTVMSRLFYARRKLQQFLRKRGITP